MTSDGYTEISCRKWRGMLAQSRGVNIEGKRKDVWLRFFPISTWDDDTFKATLILKALGGLLYLLYVTEYISIIIIDPKRIASNFSKIKNLLNII